jgi:hypothetical protein
MQVIYITSIEISKILLILNQSILMIEQNIKGQSCLKKFT